jgi:hypothetical protein
MKMQKTYYLKPDTVSNLFELQQKLRIPEAEVIDLAINELYKKKRANKKPQSENEQHED